MDFSVEDTDARKRLHSIPGLIPAETGKPLGHPCPPTSWPGEKSLADIVIENRGDPLSRYRRIG